MPEQHCHLANECEDIVDLQGAEAYYVAMRTACYCRSLLCEALYVMIDTCTLCPVQAPGL